jgi:hypothetical protein
MWDRPSGHNLARFAQPALWLIGVCWVCGCVGLLAGAYLAQFTIGRPASLDQLHHSGRLLTYFAALVMSVPVFATIVAYLAELRRAMVVWSTVVVLVAIPAIAAGAAGMWYLHAGHSAKPVPTVTRCVPRSGSMHSCPGG